MNIALIERSSGGLNLTLYSSSLDLIESESFHDLYTLNFYLQTLAKKHSIEKALLVTHDRARNTVKLSVATEESSFFIS